MFTAYFITFSLMVVCVGFAVSIMNTVKEFDKKALEKEM